MSQVKFLSNVFIGNRNIDVEVQAGWDRPLQEYFMSVFASYPGPDDDEVIWSCLDEPDATDRHGVERLELQLKRMGIEPPLGFWDIVRKSGQKNEGNIIYLWRDNKWNLF